MMILSPKKAQSFCVSKSGVGVGDCERKHFVSDLKKKGKTRKLKVGEEGTCVIFLQCSQQHMRGSMIIHTDSQLDFLYQSFCLYGGCSASIAIYRVTFF